MKNKMPRASACGGIFNHGWHGLPERRPGITLIVDGRPAAVNGLTIREISVISGSRHRRVRLRKFLWVAGIARIRHEQKE